MNLPNERALWWRGSKRDPLRKKAGVEAGDIILKFNSQSIEKLSELPRLVRDSIPGTKVKPDGSSAKENRLFCQ